MAEGILTSESLHINSRFVHNTRESDKRRRNRPAAKSLEFSAPLACQHFDTSCNPAVAPWPEITLLFVVSVAQFTYKHRGGLRQIILNS
jgi:hypothetical protein